MDRAELDWAGLMRLGLHDLGLAPSEFWALTPAELQVMSGRTAGAGGAMTRAGLEALTRSYPDETGGRNAE